MIIYKHIPRTGGNSFRSIFPEGDFLFLGHDFYSPFYKHLFYHLKRGYRHYVFTIVRNPFDRAVSAFFYLNSGGINNVDEIDKMRYIAKYRGNFKDFVRNAFPDVLRQIHFKPQYTWIYWEDECLCNNVYKFEDVIKNPDFPHKNSSKHIDYREYYDVDTVEVIKKYYKEDFELFGYSQDI